MTCLIVNGGTIHQEDIRHYINVKKEELYIIGVDGGCEILHSLGVIPHLIIGDFDTLSDTIKAIYQEQKIECITLNENKDFTDIHAAFDIVKKRGGKKVDVFGYYGTRLDHSLGTLLMAFQYGKNMEIRFLDKKNCVYLVNSPCKQHIEKNISELQQCYRYLSLIPIEKTWIEKTEQMKYPLEKTWLYPFDSIGVSNEILGKEAELTVGEGKLLIILSND